MVAAGTRQHMSATSHSLPSGILTKNAIAILSLKKTDGTEMHQNRHSCLELDRTLSPALKQSGPQGKVTIL